MTSRSMNRKAIVVGLFLITSAINVGATILEHSRNLEEGVERALIPRSTEGRDRVERVAQNWTRHFLTSAYLPPTAARYVAIPRRDAQECDYLRICYRAGNAIVTVSQTMSLFSIQLEIDRWSNEDKPDLAELQRLARALLNGADTLDLTDGERDHADVEQGGARLPDAAQAKSPWLRSLRWRQDGDRVMFWWVKYEGPMDKAVRGLSLRFNSRWFSPPDEK